MKKIIALLLAFILCSVMLTGCGGPDDPDDPNLGVWKATRGEMLGISIDVDRYFGAGFIIELNAKGKCALNIDGKEYGGKWTLSEGGEFTVKGGGIDCKGRLDNGVLTLENVLSGITLTLEKEGGDKIIFDIDVEDDASIMVFEKK